MKKVLFVLKFRQGYGEEYASGYGTYFSSGLYWSARFVSDMLNRHGVDAKLVQVNDNNDIDREVFNFKPDVVIIEALWVVPEKFDVLKKLHPDVKWIVRLHSNMPFLANEGVAIGWLKGYAERGIKIAVNDRRAQQDVRTILSTGCLPDSVLYLPNYYPSYCRMNRPHFGSHICIASYGAIRPLKNQLIQAVAAIQFADSIGKKLFFHVNATRVEQGGNAVLKNLRGLFDNTRHTLVEDEWVSHFDFLQKIRHLDIGMQVSLTETFSIVAADMVSVGVPIVTSPEIKWASPVGRANPTDSQSIFSQLRRAYCWPNLNVYINRFFLRRSSEKAEEIWLSFFHVC